MCEQKSNAARFSCMRRSYYPAKCEHAVSVKIFCTHSVYPQDFFVLSLSFIVTLPLVDLSAISPIKIAPNLNQQDSEGHDAYTHPTTTQVLTPSRHSKRSTALWQNLLVRILSPLTLLIISFASALCLDVPGMRRSSCQSYCSTRTLQ